MDSDATMGLGMGMSDLGGPSVNVHFSDEVALRRRGRVVWILLPLVLVEVRKPRRSFLPANAVNHANPVVIAFPVVHNKPTWCYPLNTQSERADWTYSQRIPSTT